MRIKLIVEYDGTNYVGWQRQKNGTSVQQMLEDAFFAAANERVSIIGAGRTDAGVHALSQTAHLDTNTTIPPQKISYAMNAHLPSDIRVKESSAVDDCFHARYGAKAKTYVYTYYNAPHASAIYRSFSAHVSGEIDIKAMSEAAKHVVGTHDFLSFCASGSEVDTSVRIVYKLQVTSEPPFIRIEITGSGFLYNMVRIIAATLMDVGKGRLHAGDLKAIITGKDRSLASATAPARGLMMKQVYYGGDDFLQA
jgi:tRNA pseudouridine38-40 synthase